MASPTVDSAIANQSDNELAPVSLDVSGNFVDSDVTDSLTWTISGLPVGSGFVIDSATGTISGTATAADIAAAPYTVIVTATDESGNSGSASLTFNPSSNPTDPGDAKYTDVTETPHSTTNAVVYRTVASLETAVNAADGTPVKRWRTGLSSPSPDGYVYQFVGDGTKSLVLDFSGDLGHNVEFPILVQNWLDLKIIGMHQFLPVRTQTYSWPNTTYPYPQTPGKIANRISVKRQVWIEGCWLKYDSDGAALNTDVFVWRSEYAATGSPSVDYQYTSFIIQNSLIEGIEGGQTPMAHADILHYQGGGDDPIGHPAHWGFENCNLWSGQQGITPLSYKQGTNNATPTMLIRNVELIINDWNSVAGDTGNAIAVAVRNVFSESDIDVNLTIENFHTSRVYNWQPVVIYQTDADQRYLVDPRDAGQAGNFYAHPEITRYDYVGNRVSHITFVEGQYLGGNYVSPHAHDHY